MFPNGFTYCISESMITPFKDRADVLETIENDIDFCFRYEMEGIVELNIQQEAIMVETEELTFFIPLEYKAECEAKMKEQAREYLDYDFDDEEECSETSD